MSDVGLVVGMLTTWAAAPLFFGGKRATSGLLQVVALAFAVVALPLVHFLAGQLVGMFCLFVLWLVALTVQEWAP